MQAQTTAGLRRHAAVWVLVGMCCVVEIVLTLADLGLAGPPRLRLMAYEYGGFWPGLLQDWRPNYTGQPALMFVTYAFLHGGPMHLIVNMLTLVSLGVEVVRRVGQSRFVLIYALSMLGGGLGFGLLAPTLRPMVGASGALFGLAGALLVWEWVERRVAGESVRPVLRYAALLVVLNGVLWWAMNGQLAWETHLGGFVAGALGGLLVRPRDGMTARRDAQ